MNVSLLRRSELQDKAPQQELATLVASGLFCALTGALAGPQDGKLIVERRNDTAVFTSVFSSGANPRPASSTRPLPEDLLAFAATWPGATSLRPR